jgi:hypothetical protein
MLIAVFALAILALAVSAAGAAASPTFTQQGAKIQGENGIGGPTSSAGFGGPMTLAVSPDGSTALMASPEAGCGKVVVYTRSGSEWTQQATLLPTGELGTNDCFSHPPRFGDSVALSSAGSIVLVGAPGDDFNAGSLWVFKRSGSTWTQQGPKLVPSDEIGNGFFGASVALAGNGKSAVIGGPFDNGFVGAAWSFKLSHSQWSQQGSKLTATGESGKGELGASVSLASNGKTALFGAPEDDGEIGAAWIFTGSGASWTQGPELLAEGESGAAAFGESTALSKSGKVAVVGGPDDEAGNGAAWAFARSGTSWAQQGSKLTGAGGVGSPHFGASAALSGDGKTALFGGPEDNGKIGATWAFTFAKKTGWSELEPKLTASDETGEGRFGTGLALSSDGNTALIGGQGDNNHKGAVWTFGR